MKKADETSRTMQLTQRGEHRPRLASGPQTAPTGRTVVLKQATTRELLRRLGKAPTPLSLDVSSAEPISAPASPSVEDQFNAAIGCKTSEVALTILAQVVKFDHADDALSDDRMTTFLMNATAMLAELQPATATEALLAAQMIGAQRVAMTFLHRATLEGQTPEGTDANVLRATRLMRLFNEQVETMGKLKGTNGQQRVVVEHVNVAAGGQAIVGAVNSGGRATSGHDRR